MTDLAFHVHQFLPDAVGEELEHRIALLKARDWSAALRGQTDPGPANDFACEAHEVAGAFVFSEGEPVERLAVAVRLCRHLVGASMDAQQLEGGRA